MRLKELLRVLSMESPVDMDISSISCDSRLVQKGSLFVAIDGLKDRGGNYIDEAIKRGAACIIATDNKSTFDTKSIPLIKHSDTHSALAILADEFFGHPSGKIKVVGVTGTNGKTTITYLVENIFKEAGLSSGIIGTICYSFKDKIIPACNTTPSALQLQPLLKQMLDAGCNYCIMEVSSHGLHQKRTLGIDFKAAIFTNLTQDHLDYHKNLEDYFLAKSRLFSGLSADAYSIVNADSPYAVRLKGLTPARFITYGIDSQADVSSCDLVLNGAGSEFLLKAEKFKFESKIKTSLIGKYNISNILAGAAFALTQGIPAGHIKKGIENFNGVKGRLEKVTQSSDTDIFIDYAHTPDALENVLDILRQFSRGGLIVVFGCGGDRDRLKRPLMGSVADKYADFIVITSDNPRSEDPALIAVEISGGIRHKDYKIILDRREAIQFAVSRAKIGDTVLIAGKGHESYQIFQDKRIEFDDRKVVEECLAEKVTTS